MDEEKLITKHMNDKVQQVAFTGEEVLYEFINDDNITYVIIRKKDEDENYHYAILPIAYFSFPAEIKQKHIGLFKNNE